MAKQRSIIVDAGFCRVRLLYSRVRRVVRIGVQDTAGTGQVMVADLPVADFLDRLGVAGEAASDCFVIFAGQGETPGGGIEDFVRAFGAEDAARASFERLCETARTDWAQLVRLQPRGEPEVLCWRGPHTAPHTRRDLELLLDGPSVTMARDLRPSAPLRPLGPSSPP